MSEKTSRRNFIAGAASAAAGVAVARGYALGADSKNSPNDKLNVALIGCGARGRQVLISFKNNPGVRMVAACDVNSKYLAHGRHLLGGEKIVAEKDFRKIMDNKDVDAVIIATQAHWHVLPIIAACQAGKDVYAEKPMGNSIGEGKFAIQAAKKYNRIVQTGTQQRSRKHYHEAVKLIREGKLGNISQVKVRDFENWYPSNGSPADCAPPKELDWDFYVGPAPMRPYNPNCYYGYGYDWVKLSGGGHQVAWGVHHFDVVLWAMGVKYPKKVSAMGGQYAFKDNREWPNTMSAILEFGPGPVAKDGFVMQYDMRIGCRREARSHGKCFLGTEASMTVDRSRYTVVPEVLGRKKSTPYEGLVNKGQETLASDDEAKHTQVFLDNVRNRTQPFANCETCHHATNLGHLMNISWQLGRTIHWDGENDRAIDDPEANKLVNKPYRAPWKLEV